MKRKRKPTKAKVRRLTLALWSKAVRKRAGNKCEVCGTPDGQLNAKGNPRRLNAHHIEDRANQRLRFDLMNGIALCPNCHKFGLDSAHRSPIWFMRWLNCHDRERYDHVSMFRGDTMTPDILEAMKERIKEALK